MTANMLIEAISIALNGEFGDEYEIHMEEIKQDLKEPCFFIQSLKPEQEQFLGPRYRQQHNFCIQYFPQTQEVQRECNDIGDRMLECLEYIVLPEDDQPIRGTRISSEVLDGVLNFYVNYDGFILKLTEEEPMEEIDRKVVPKEESDGS